MSHTPEEDLSRDSTEWDQNPVEELEPVDTEGGVDSDFEPTDEEIAEGNRMGVELPDDSDEDE